MNHSTMQAGQTAADTAQPQAASTPPNTAATDDLTTEIYRRLAHLLDQPQSPQNLGHILRLLAKWRSTLLLGYVQRRDGTVVQSGPFKGMRYLPMASEGSTVTRLLGAYEAALHSIIETIVQRGYDQVMDVGCAEGYYAIGMARRLPAARILARDSDPAARGKCAELARLNGVSAQIDIGGAVAHGDFAVCSHAYTVVICDIEGAEAHLLDPSLAPGLLAADILVEVHDCFSPGLSQTLAQRFAASHDVQLIQRSLTQTAMPTWMDALSDMDRLLALWEWRSGPTPWLWMTAKSSPPRQTYGSQRKPD